MDSRGDGGAIATPSWIQLAQVESLFVRSTKETFMSPMDSRGGNSEEDTEPDPRNLLSAHNCNCRTIGYLIHLSYNFNYAPPTVTQGMSLVYYTPIAPMTLRTSTCGFLQSTLPYCNARGCPSPQVEFNWRKWSCYFVRSTKETFMSSNGFSWGD